MKGRLPVYKESFFLGPGRADGLQLQMFYEDGYVYSDFFVDNRFEGYRNVVHGGITFGVLDSLLWSIIFMEAKKIAMTRKVEMEFTKPIHCNTHYKALSKLLGMEGKDIRAVAWVEDSNGETYAKVEAVFREAKGINTAALLKRFDFSVTTPEMKEYFLSRAEEK